jgi:hypothetical protein
VTAISPAIGPPGGGTPVTITGTALTRATSVRFGTTPGTILTNTATTITVTTPAHKNGTVNVTVTTPYGTSAITPADEFTIANPLSGAMVIVKLDGSDGETQIAKLLTDEDGVFSFNVTSETVLKTYTFNCYITAPPEYKLKDGATNEITIVEKVSDGPNYAFILWWEPAQNGQEKAQGKGSFAVSGKSAN